MNQQQLGEPLSGDEVEFISKHPGGFDRAFFERTLPTTGAAFAHARGDTIVVVHTAYTSIVVVSARVSLTWAEFRTEDGDIEYIPFREIVRISVAPRPPEQEPRHPIGFTAEPLADDQPPPSPPSATGD